MTSLGIDIGGSAVKSALIDHDGNVLATARSARYSRPDSEAILAAARQAVSHDTAGVSTVGLCVPGLLDASGGKVIFSANVPGLVGMPLTDLVERAVGRPLIPRVESDAYAAAHDLMMSRKLAGRVLVLSLGTGVGASVLDDGVPLLIDGSSPGHFGQLDVSLSDDPPIGPDGGAGGLEAYIGAATLTREYGDPSEAFAQFTGNEPPLRALARGIRIAHAIYRPHHVILAGGIGLGLAPLLPIIKKMIDVALTRIARPGWTLSVADDDFHAARGVAMLAARP